MMVSVRKDVLTEKLLLLLLYHYNIIFYRMRNIIYVHRLRGRGGSKYFDLAILTRGGGDYTLLSCKIHHW